MIFVFGSNLAGRHGAGAALYAKQHCGAILGCGHGLRGNSYAIPTKDANMKVLHLGAIKQYVDEFIDDANYYLETEPKILFKVTAIGTGLAGYKHEDIAPFFSLAPDNCVFDIRWASVDYFWGREQHRRFFKS